MPAQPPGPPPTGGGSTRRAWLIVAAVVAILVVGGAVLAFALSDGDKEKAASGPTGATSVTGPTSPTGTTDPSTEPTGPTGATGQDTGNAGCAGATAPETLADGTYFGFLESLDVDTGVSTFDLACFYTGEEANQQAAARGDEVPVPNDVYIVNDNPATRDVPVDPSAELLLIDWNACCETGPGATLDGLASALGHKNFVEIDGWKYAGSLSPYWVTIANGQIVGIEEQFLP
ncbi:MAG TPA: hypothetical protein VGQ01_06390, partial [Actinomycetota bacterium]|nr:hypothetical protein [Actinomycetota bacterium]